MGFEIRITGVMIGCSFATVPFILGMYRLDLLTRNETLTHQLSRMLERRFSHRRVPAIIAENDDMVAAEKAKRPPMFQFEVPIDPRVVVDRRRQSYDELNAATWGIDPRVNIEMHSKSMAQPTDGIDRVLAEIADARQYLKTQRA